LTLSDPDTKKREITGLIEALTTHQLNQGLILTLDEEGQEVYVDNGIAYSIIIMPVWKWAMM